MEIIERLSQVYTSCGLIGLFELQVDVAFEVNGSGVSNLQDLSLL